MQAELKTKSSKKFLSGRVLEICQGDITLSHTDAIVNAANSRLMHGGGVALAIARKGGQIVKQESRAWVKEHGLVTHRQPAFTRGGNLPCKSIIHAVGPVWGEGDEETKLSSAIRGSLALAEHLETTSISFPAISTGIFGFPVDLAADIFLKEFLNYFKKPGVHPLKLIRLVLYEEAALAVFQKYFNHDGLAREI